MTGDRQERNLRKNQSRRYITIKLVKNVHLNIIEIAQKWKLGCGSMRIDADPVRPPGSILIVLNLHLTFLKL
jgi:hypothetical protein